MFTHMQTSLGTPMARNWRFAAVVGLYTYGTLRRANERPVWTDTKDLELISRLIIVATCWPAGIGKAVCAFGIGALDNNSLARNPTSAISNSASMIANLPRPLAAGNSEFG